MASKARAQWVCSTWTVFNFVRDAPTASEALSWFEAESGTITAALRVFADSPTASAGQHIGTVDGIGDENGILQPMALRPIASTSPRTVCTGLPSV